MMDFETFWNMGGYAFNVWTSYGLAIVMYGALAAFSITRLHRLRKQAQDNA